VPLIVGADWKQACQIRQEKQQKLEKEAVEVVIDM